MEVSFGSLMYSCADHRFGQIAGSFHLKFDQDVPFLFWGGLAVVQPSCHRKAKVWPFGSNL